MVEDPLVEALESRRQQRQGRLERELLDEFLVELPSLRRERDHAMLRRAAVYGVECRRDDVDTQHHPGATPVRVVVDLARRSAASSRGS